MTRRLPVILMYHRVASLAIDPWHLAVRPDVFAEQMRELSASRSVVPMTWLARELREGRVPFDTAAITFDDGYADVLHNAKPILEKYDCPATMFLTTRAVSDPRVFWWDVLARIVLETDEVPGVLKLDMLGQTHIWSVETRRRARREPSDGLSRDDLHMALYPLIRALEPSYRLEVLARLAEWARTGSTPHHDDRPMTADEVRELISPDLIELGAHSLSHPLLSTLSPSEIEFEIVESRRECQEFVNAKVAGLAYPYGDCNETVIRVAENAAFDYAVDTRSRPVTLQDDATRLFSLPRIQVCSWPKREFRQKVLDRTL
jgi:peptidoglycan/xylan/chitin deacetylase (PgdA/CDA1 family)